MFDVEYQQHLGSIPKSFFRCFNLKKKVKYYFHLKIMHNKDSVFEVQTLEVQTTLYNY